MASHFATFLVGAWFGANALLVVLRWVASR